jgi:hypothetical protein
MAIKRTIVISAETKAAQKSVDELTELLELQDAAILRLTDDQEKYEDKLQDISKTNFAGQKKYNDLLKETNRELKKEVKAKRTLEAEQKKANKTLAEATKKQNKLSGVMGELDKLTGGAISSFGRFYTSIMTAVKGMSLLKIAWIATGIGAFVVLITSLVAAFKRSEEGQEKLQVGLAMLGAVVNQIMDAFANLGTAIFDAITNPKQALIDFKDAFVENVTNRISSAIETIGFLGSAIKKVLKRDFSGAMEDAKKAGSSYIDTMTGVKNTIDKVSDSITGLVDETLSEVSAMAQVTKARQKAHHIERELQVERAKANREINDIRLQAEDRLNNTASERVDLLRKAQAIEEDITNKEIAAKQLLIQAQELEMEQGLNTIQAKDKLAKLQAEAINLDTKKLRSQRLLQTQITTALNEEIAAQKVIDDLASAKILKAEEDEKTRLQSIKDIQDEFEQSVEEERAVKEEEKAILQKEKELQELEDLNATEEQKAAIIAYWDGKILEGKETDAEEQKKLEKAVVDAKLDIAKQSMALIGEIAGKGSKIGKAMAIGQATISGYEGVQNAFTTANDSPITAGFPAYPFIQAGLAGAFAAVNIQKIASTKPTGSSGTAGLKSVASAGAQAPSFNIVGQSGSNQIASALGEQQQTPIQAYVVSQDVTTAQSLENGIIQGATLGG